VEGVGEDVFAEVLGGMGFFQPVVAALVGLIPNCAASVLMTRPAMGSPLKSTSPLLTPPIRVARPPASTRPIVFALSGAATAVFVMASLRRQRCCR
jgi:hypothetical protein